MKTRTFGDVLAEVEGSEITVFPNARSTHVPGRLSEGTHEAPALGTAGQNLSLTKPTKTPPMKQSDTAQLEWLAAFYREAADTGREIQHSSDGRSTWSAAVRGPSTDSSPPHWRLKPEPQKAFLVWVEGSRWPGVFETREQAEQYRQLNPAPTQIQEVERTELP